ncbi:MAG: N-acetylmuramoyl-L-alanine amidase [Candidatus Riflebacteria bacterium]|nr:N-acetylmuramoyl-L-alanine amidase [Candidatus Riflebacteria bacterium]
MKKWFIFVSLVFTVFSFSGINLVFADEDCNEYQIAVNLGFKLENQAYGKFETQVFELPKPMDNLLISIDVQKSPDSIFRSYASFKDKQTGKWTSFQEFEGEFHFANIHPVTAYQLLFIIRDPKKGTTLIRRFTAQGENLGEEVMQKLSQKPVPYQPGNQWAKPTIVSRQEWGARPPKSSYTPMVADKIIVHHSWSPTQAQYKGAATIRGIQNYHMDDPSTGWIDIGYHFLIGPDGVIYQGRPETDLGAHCKPNTGMIGICMIGDYDPGNDLVNDKMEKSLLDLLSWLSSTYKLDPRSTYYGHRNFSPKTCPGDLVYDRMDFYRSEVFKNIGGTNRVVDED